MWTYFLKHVLNFVCCLIAAFSFYLLTSIEFLLKLILNFKIHSGIFLLEGKPKRIEFLKWISNHEDEWLTEYRTYYSFFHWYYKSNKCCKIEEKPFIWSRYSFD